MTRGTKQNKKQEELNQLCGVESSRSPTWADLDLASGGGIMIMIINITNVCMRVHTFKEGTVGHYSI